VEIARDQEGLQDVVSVEVTGIAGAERWKKRI